MREIVRELTHHKAYQVGRAGKLRITGKGMQGDQWLEGQVGSIKGRIVGVT